MQIVLWIAVPGTILAIVVTTILHYRRKKKMLQAGEEYEERFRLAISTAPGSLPDWLASSDPGNQSLLKKYEREIRRYKENYATLEQDFQALEEKYGDLLNKAYTNDPAMDNGMAQMQQEIKSYKLKIAQLQQALEFSEQNRQPVHGDAGEEVLQLQATIRELQESLQQQHEEHALEINRLEALLSGMEQQVAAAKDAQPDLEQLTAENYLLRQQLQAGEAGEGFESAYSDQLQEWQRSLSQLREENNLLLEKLAEYQYMQDLLEEKKLQTDFLQQQLEQRIKNYHLLEKQAGEATAELQQLRNMTDDYQHRIDALLEELGEKRAETGQLQAELDSSRETLREKNAEMEKLESMLKELRQEQLALHSVSEDKQDALRELEATIAREQQKTTQLENKLQQSSELLVRIYSELGRSVQAGLMQLPHGLALDFPGAATGIEAEAGIEVTGQESVR